MASSHLPDPASAVVILNASLDVDLREARARVLHQAGYYTSSAESAEEVLHLAASLRCPIVIVCNSFSDAERGKICAIIRATAPTTTVILLNEFAANDPRILVDRVKKALQRQT